MYLVSLEQHWLESLPGFIYLVAKTLTGSCKGHVKPNWNREACDTSYQVHIDIILQDLCKDDKPSIGDSWEEHSIGWYSWQKGRNQE